MRTTSPPMCSSGSRSRQAGARSRILGRTWFVLSRTGPTTSVGNRTGELRRELTTFDFGTAPIVEPAVDLRRQIAALSLQQRAVVFFTYWEDMTIPAIADLLGLSSGTVHRNLTRARAQLRKALQ